MNQKIRGLSSLLVLSLFSGFFINSNAWGCSDRAVYNNSGGDITVDAYYYSGSNPIPWGSATVPYGGGFTYPNGVDLINISGNNLGKNEILVLGCHNIDHGTTQSKHRIRLNRHFHGTSDGDIRVD